MGFRTTIVIAILLVLLGAYAYFIEYKGGKEKEEKEEQAKVLLEIKKEEIAEIRISGLEKPVKILPAAKDSWQIAEPIQQQADETTVERFVNAAEKLKYKEIIEEQPKDLASYELDPPKLTVTYVQKKPNQLRSIMIGAKNPIESSYYIRMDKDPRVYLVDSMVGDLSNITLFELRDKKLTDFESEKVESIRIATEKQEILFQKSGGVWKMKKPIASPAAESEISSLLSSFESLRATKFIDPPITDPGQYGLQEPSATVELTLGKGLQQRILFGQKEESDIYCQIGGKPQIAAVSDSFTTTFEKNLEDWREKKVVVFNRFDAEEVFFKTGGKQYHFKKESTDDEEKWKQLSPQKGEIQEDQIQDLLEKLENAEISKYGEKPNLDGSPSMDINLTLKDWEDKVTKKHLTFATVTDNTLPVKNDDYSTIVFTAGSLLQELQKGREEIKIKAPAAAENKK